jgi:Protein of unknown function (DUF2961)
MRTRNTSGIIILCLVISGCTQKATDVKDLTYFIHHLYTLDDMPVLENSHTYMSCTWDTTGGNSDGDCFKNRQGPVNVLLDTDGPGCIHRIFTGVTYGFIDVSTFGTKIQVFIDNNPEPIWDMEVTKFFDDHTGPFPYPFVFQKTYPGILFPIPFASHCKIQLVNDRQVNWGNYWQVVYTKYTDKTIVKSISYPFSKNEQKEIDKACKAWIKAESSQPEPPSQWTVNKRIPVESGKINEIRWEGKGIIKHMRISVKPNTSEVLQKTRLQIQWDGRPEISVDVPLGYFFGNADYQNQKQFSSLLLGINETEVYSLFPMPFSDGFVISFNNKSDKDIENISVKLLIEKKKTIPDNWGRFHATWTEIQIDSTSYQNYPRFGKSVKPFQVLLDVKGCRGKYVGNMLHVAWPYPTWWGEGDWLIWSDESGFPPGYHGTGTEEYYNSGWCWFDKKAVSGFITQKPANVFVYSFHMNDNFQFQNSIKVANEVWWHRDIMRSIYGGTAFWYAYPPQDANSRRTLISPRLVHDMKTGEFRWE